MRAMVKKTALNFPTRKGETRIQPPAGWVGAVRRPLGGRAAAVVGKSWQLRKRPLGAVDAAGQPRAAKKCARLIRSNSSPHSWRRRSFAALPSLC